MANHLASHGYLVVSPDHTTFKSVPAFEIFKRLPRTNCRSCGFSTCMAFAVALSKQEASLDQCPDLNNPANEQTVKLQSLFM